VAFNLIAINQGQMLRNNGYNMSGVCLELCRRWVRSRMMNATFQQTMQLIGDNCRIHAVVSQQRARPRDRQTSGLEYKTKKTRLGMSGAFSIGGLVSRRDVIRYVLDHRGVYIYSFNAMQGGHAFAFDSRDENDFFFFDANQGGWQITGEDRDTIKDWWWNFWDASGAGDIGGAINYKTFFSHGTRKLTRYTALPDI
jgi:hypothetical protein